jgi:peptidoglycan/xylan/chitin deacetylase (PgdA/CDA1 family)
LIHTGKFSIALLLAWGIIIASLLAGCAALPLVDTTTGYYRSEDYVVYKAKPGDTAESIAKQFLGDPQKAWVIKDANDAVLPDRYIVVTLKNSNPGGVYEKGVQQVAILCYHHFDNSCSSPLCVPANTFDRQMKFLKENDYVVITPEQLMAFLELREPLPRKSAMITIDDGYRSAYRIAYPILKKYGFTATLFVYTDYVGVSGKAITWDQLRELKANGFTIGSHTKAHSDLSKRGALESVGAYTARLKRELDASKQIIDRQLKQSTFFLAYPFGRTNPDATRMAQRAGYRLAVTVNRGGNAFYQNPYLLHRDQILKKDMATFKKRLRTFQPLSLR